MLGILLLITVLFSIVAYLFMFQKEIELTTDIFEHNLSYVELTGANLIHDYELYLEQNSFVYFNREIQKSFMQLQDVEEIQIINFNGDIVYDSSLDSERKYEGNDRKVTNEFLLDQIKSKNISIKIKDSGSIYLKTDVEGNYTFVDFDEKYLNFSIQSNRVDYFVYPVNENYSVTYHINYNNLDQRIADMRTRIIYTSSFGVLLGLLLAIWLSANLTEPLHKLEQGFKNVAKGDFTTRVYINTSDEIAFLGDTFNRMTKELGSTLGARLYQERISHELALAKQIQKQILPKNIPTAKGIEISASLLSAGEIGGDMYDFLPSFPGHYLFYLGDVTGHGVPAGIISSIASALFYGFATTGDLKQVVVAVNNVLRVKTMPNMFMTLCLMDWEEKLNKFSFVSAGHEQIVHYSAASEKSFLAPAGGIGIGMVQNIEAHLKIDEISLGSGDFVVIYSDGIPEAWRSKTETYGMDRFVDSINSHGKVTTAKEMKNAIIKDLQNFTAGYKQMDDITIIVIKKL